ncbi:histidine phosphatase family protein [Candidatus Parcubacteria bacterium]|nr:MAG: histidine phosphatase family protein [Candidatus Parcubacteria bacterium]
MKTIYLVRHGESEGNTKSIFQPADCPLSERGKEQAEFIAKRCATLGIETILTSPTTRALETAKIVAERISRPLAISDLFHEHRKPSVLIGKPLKDESVQEMERAWTASLSGGPRVEDSENFDDLRERAGKALEFLIAQKEEKILVVTHGIFLKMLIARAVFGQDLTGAQFLPLSHSFWMENSGITTLWYGAQYPDGRPVNTEWVLWTWNDHAHLGETS